MNVQFFRSVFGRKWNFIFVDIFVYGRKFKKTLFGRPLYHKKGLCLISLDLEKVLVIRHCDLPLIFLLCIINRHSLSVSLRYNAVYQPLSVVILCGRLQKRNSFDPFVIMCYFLV